MPKPFKLIGGRGKYSEIDKEWQWTYQCLFKLIIDRKEINKITITDHPWKKKGRKKITKQLILNLIKEKLDSKPIKPTQYSGKIKPYVIEGIPFKDKVYKIVFWFERNSSDWIWVRCFHPQGKKKLNPMFSNSLLGERKK